MALDAQKALQLSALLAQHATMFTAANPGQNAFAHQLLGSAQAGIMAEALKKQKKKEEKKKKGALGGKLGSALGTAAGIALAPATGGASLALAGAAGGALGGVAGQALSGGGFNAMDTAGYGVQGAISGYNYGKQGELSESVENAATPQAPAAPPPAESVANDVKNSISVAGQGVQPGSAVKRMIPPTRPSRYPTSLKTAAPPMPATKPARPGFFSRFANTLGATMQPTPRFRIQRNPTGIPDVYYED